MRTLLIPLLGLLASAAPARAQAWANKLFKDGTSHDFGTVAYGAQLFHRFRMTNIYAVPLEITDIRSTCGCVTATPGKKVLQPKEETYVEVSMDARRFKGPKTVSVHLTVGPKYISTAELRLTATSRADIVFNPGQVNFGVVAAGATPSQTIDIEYAGLADWKITEVASGGGPVTVEMKELYRRPREGAGYQLKVTLKADVPPGPLRQQLHLKTNDPTTPTITVLVEAQIEAALSVSPATLRLGEIRVGDSLTRKVVVQGKKPFKVTAVEGLGEGVTLVNQLPTASAAVQVLNFKIQPEKAGEWNRSVQIKTDLQTAPVAFALEATVSP